MAKKSDGHTPVEAITHGGKKRTNIPTADAHEFVTPEVEAPRTVLYPRNPSLDPQLVWRGKDEQDSQDLEVDAPPIYIQEKIDPRVLVENLRKTAEEGEDEPELTLFDDFDGLNGLEDIEYYQHAANWSNRMILGDSLQVMTSLVEREALRGHVQMVYMDPPYGIKFRSNWQARVSSRQVSDGELEDVSREVEQIRAFRDTWEMGIHSYLAYMRDRLTAARELLSESGCIFVQIGDENAHLVRSVLDEVFGSDNFVVTISFQKKAYQDAEFLAPVNDFILLYAKNRSRMKYRSLFTPRPFEGDVGKYRRIVSPDGTEESVSGLTDEDIRQRLTSGWRLMRNDYPLVSQDPPSEPQPFEFGGKIYEPTPGRHWSVRYPDGMERLAAAGRIRATDRRLYYREFWDDSPLVPLSNMWTGFKGPDSPRYVVETLDRVVSRCVLLSTDPGDLVLDPTCGGGTTAYVAEKWGRRWITADTSRVALALTRQRLMASVYPYYVLRDSPEGRKELVARGHEFESEMEKSDFDFDVREGFVYERAQNITMKAIALNEDIRPDMSDEAIDEAIRRNAEHIDFLDRPVVDRGRVRVSGPMTVESLSPHRSMGSGMDAEAAVKPSSWGFEQMILENLEVAGIQNGRRQERLEVDAVEPKAGPYINAEANVRTGSDDAIRRIGISIGPQYGTIGPSFIKAAAREAIQAGDLDILCILGFAFDPAAIGTLDDSIVTSDEGFDVAAERKLGNVPVLIVRMNADLVMGDELRKTKAGNLFTVFGEPEISVVESGEDHIVVELLGVDVYDPTTGELRSDSTDQIAIWMIDTDYNGESFFVRDCYFTGGDDPYKRLQRALKADIDEDAWDTLYRTESRPFPRPATGKIAVKVINDYGDEVMKILEV